MICRFNSLIVNIGCRIIVPFIFIYGLYVIVFGHYSAGGGFQGGIILAAGVILMRLCVDRKTTYKKYPPRMGLILGAIGVIIYASTGIVTMLAGGNYLDYAFLPIQGMDIPDRRYYGILIVELGVALGVFGVMTSIFDSLTKEK